MAGSYSRLGYEYQRHHQLSCKAYHLSLSPGLSQVSAEDGCRQRLFGFNASSLARGRLGNDRTPLRYDHRLRRLNFKGGSSTHPSIICARLIWCVINFIMMPKRAASCMWHVIQSFLPIPYTLDILCATASPLQYAPVVVPNARVGAVCSPANQRFRSGQPIRSTSRSLSNSTSPSLS